MLWSEVSTEMGNLLGDPNKSTFPDTARKTAWNGATRYFATGHTAPLKRTAVTPVAVSSHWEAALPSGLVGVSGVETDDRWLEPQMMQPGELKSSVGYIVMPGLLYFSSDPGEITIWYYSLYAAAVADNTALDIPDWAYWALLHLSIAYTLTPQMISQAGLRQYQEKRDAGQPEMNPMRVQANWHIRQYEEMISRFAPQDREMAYKPGR